MSLPGFAVVTPFILSQGEKGGGFYVSLPGFLSVTPFILSQGEKGMVLTCVSTWLSFCHSIHVIAR